MHFQYIIAKQSAMRLTQNGILAQLGEHLPYKQRVIGSSPIGPIPVSYTHLDVYKRQQGGTGVQHDRI